MNLKNKIFMAMTAVLCFICLVACNSEVTTEKTSWKTMWYLDMTNLDAMNDLNQMIAANPTLNDGFEVYIISGGAKTKTTKTDAENNPFTTYADGSYKYAYLAQALIDSGIKDDGKTNPFQDSFKSNSYQYWTFMADKDGKGVFNKANEHFKLMSDGSNLTLFINDVYAKTKDTNSKYILFMWNHGGGSVDGLCGDYTTQTDNNYPWMGNSDLAKAIEDSNFYKAGKKFDAIVFDMCNMQTIEDAYLVKKYAKCMVGSENYSTASGYGQFFKYLNDNPRSSYSDVAKQFIYSAASKHQIEQKYDYTWSAIDLTNETKLNSLKDAYITFIKDVVATSKSDFAEFVSATDNSPLYVDDGRRATSYDILSVADRLYSKHPDLKDNYVALASAINAVLIDNNCGIDVSCGKDKKEPGSTGLAFFFFERNQLKDYKDEKGKPIAAFEDFKKRVKDYFSADVADFYQLYFDYLNK